MVYGSSSQAGLASARIRLGGPTEDEETAGAWWCSPAIEAAYERAAEAEPECGYPEGCCEHRGRDEHGCWDCLNTGHTHETEPITEGGPL